MVFALKAQKSVSQTTKRMHKCETNQKKDKFRDKIE